MNRVAQLYPRALGSLSVASYDSQGYGGGIVTHLYKGQFPMRLLICEIVPVVNSLNTMP
jgi:hypothetical protein